MHVETGGDPNTILNGKAVPFTINNQFLVRGDKVQFRKDNNIDVNIIKNEME
jgi:hypothetical protein